MHLSWYPSNTTLVCKDKGTQRQALCIAVHPIQNNNICDTVHLDTSGNLEQALPYITWSVKTVFLWRWRSKDSVVLMFAGCEHRDDTSIVDGDWEGVKC